MKVFARQEGDGGAVIVGAEIAKVNNSASMKTLGANGIAVFSPGRLTGGFADVTNSGTISATATGGVAISAGIAGGNIGSVVTVNNLPTGVIEADTQAIVSNTGSADVTNAGTIRTIGDSSRAINTSGRRFVIRGPFKALERAARRYSCNRPHVIVRRIRGNLDVRPQTDRCRQSRAQIRGLGPGPLLEISLFAPVQAFVVTAQVFVEGSTLALGFTGGILCWCRAASAARRAAVSFAPTSASGCTNEAFAAISKQ